MFKFNHFNFNVLDLDRSLKFYKDALGLEPVREKDAADGSYKISLRTGTHANAAEICRVLGGGGHPAAAGCTVNLPLSEAIDKIVAVIGDTVDGIRD